MLVNMHGELVYNRQLEAIFETITDIIIIFDAQGNVVAENFRDPERLYGSRYSARSLIERWETLGLLDEQGQPLSLDNFPPYRILQGETLTGAKSLDVLLPLPNSKLRYFNVGGAPIRDASGNITGAVMVCRDVTERRLLEQEKQQLAQEAQTRASRLETIIDSLVDAVFIYDAQGNILQMNKTARKLLGLSDEKWYVSHHLNERLLLLELRDPRGNPISEEHYGIARLLRGEVLTDSNGIDIFMRTLDGREIYGNVSGAPLRDSAGNIIGAVGVARDVTERYRLEQQIQALAQEAQTRASWLEAIIDSMAEGVVIYDQNRKIQLMNATLRKAMGIENLDAYSTSECEQRANLYEFRNMHGQKYPAYPRSLDLALEQGKVTRREVEVIRPDGRRKTMF